MLSRVTAYDWMGSLALLPIGYVLAGPLGEALGAAEVLAVGSAARAGRAGARVHLGVRCAGWQPQRPRDEHDDVAADPRAPVLHLGQEPARAAHLDALGDLEPPGAQPHVRVRHQRTGRRPGGRTSPSSSLGNDRARAESPSIAQR